tara:strand:- start:10040 stop:10669 length:630 start_codon:yes stop_codon:yes gene_type:complete
MYIRNLRKPSPNKNVFKFASAKVRETIMCESTLEFDVCFYHEYNEAIEHYGSQPEGFEYRFKGKNLPYTPDTLIRYVDQTEKYHEYKPYSLACDPIFREKFAAKQEASLKLGIELILVTEKQIRINPILNNLKLLHRYSGIYGINVIQHELLKFVQKSGRITLKDICSEFKLTPGVSRSFLCSLIHKGILKTELYSDDLTLNPTVWRPS